MLIEPAWWPDLEDYYVDVGGHAVDAEVGAVTLVEGNYFVRSYLIRPTSVHPPTHTFVPSATTSRHTLRRIPLHA